MNPIFDIQFDWAGKLREANCYHEENSSNIKVNIVDNEIREKFFDRITFLFDIDNSVYTILGHKNHPILKRTILHAALRKLGELLAIHPRQ